MLHKLSDKPTTIDIPPIDSPRIQFETDYPTGNPEEWCTSYGDNGLEHYDSEYEEYPAYSYWEGSTAMYLDGKLVHSLDYTITEDREDCAPDSDIEPTNQEVYDDFVKIASGQRMKAAAVQLCESLTSEQKLALETYMASYCKYLEANDHSDRLEPIQNAWSEFASPLPPAKFKPSNEMAASLAFELFLHLKYETDLPDEMSGRLNGISDAVRGLPELSKSD